MFVLLLKQAYPTLFSVPNGATLQRLNLDYLDNCIDYFADKSRIILAVDQDEAGENLKNEFIRRFGAEVCATVDWADCKDANDYLLAHGSNATKQVITDAVDVPLDNVVTVNDIEDELNEFITEGFKPGFQIGLDNFDDIFSTYTGQFITVTGIPSSGKATGLIKWPLDIIKITVEIGVCFSREQTYFFTRSQTYPKILERNAGQGGSG